MTGAPIRTPYFVAPKANVDVLHIDGLDGDDPMVVRVRIMAAGSSHVVAADLTRMVDVVSVDAPLDGPVRFTIEGYLTRATPLPENAERIVAVAGHPTVEVDYHACPHISEFGCAYCRWCGDVLYPELVPEDAPRELTIRVEGAPTKGDALDAANAIIAEMRAEGHDPDAPSSTDNPVPGCTCSMCTGEPWWKRLCRRLTRG